MNCEWYRCLNLDIFCRGLRGHSRVCVLYGRSTDIGSEAYNDRILLFLYSDPCASQYRSRNDFLRFHAMTNFLE